MPVKNKIGDEYFLKNVPLPQETKSYTVISHEDIIKKVEQTLNDNNFYIKNKKYQYSFGGEVVLASLEIHSSKDLDIGMTFNWCNSYNKKLRFGCYVGGFIYSNNAMFVGSDGINWLRKHTGTANEESMNVIENVIAYANEFFDNLICQKNDMRNTPITADDYNNILGQLYFGQKQLTSSQASAIIKVKEERNNNNDFTDDNNLWGLYKDVMYGLDGTDVTKWQLQQQKIHYTILNNWCAYTTQLEEIDINEPKTQPQVAQTQELTVEEEYAEYCVDNSEYNLDLVNYYMLFNSTKGLTKEEFCNNFSNWASGQKEDTVNNTNDTTVEPIPPCVGHSLETEEEETVDDTPEITGIPNGDTMSDTDDVQSSENYQVDLEKSITEVESENTKTNQFGDEDHVDGVDEIPEQDNAPTTVEDNTFVTVDDDIEDLLDLF
jgi:hypothetical protein